MCAAASRLGVQGIGSSGQGKRTATTNVTTTSVLAVDPKQKQESDEEYYGYGQ